MQQWIEGLQQTALSQGLMNSAWAWPLLEILHFMGLSLLFGALIVFDLRMVGLFRSLPLSSLQSLPRLMLAGFIVNLTSGILFFIGDPGRYAINVGFQAKLLLVLLAGLNAVWFMRKYSAALPGWRTGDDIPRQAGRLALASLVLWTAVLLLGRLIPYVGTG